eukprot:TRINITY_DN1440_c0_g2_i2.p1 TRINITY_DN1440_c0_g2~~TRINITY_DN1440_c0_g2_i2.p1  ORF type:complete len:343 (+),score=69.92 TRINITY_DN1440_c0_g2_i2:277-1305(+)
MASIMLKIFNSSEDLSPTLSSSAPTSPTPKRSGSYGLRVSEPNIRKSLNSLEVSKVMDDKRRASILVSPLPDGSLPPASFLSNPYIQQYHPQSSSQPSTKSQLSPRFQEQKSSQQQRIPTLNSQDSQTRLLGQHRNTQSNVSVSSTTSAYTPERPKLDERKQEESLIYGSDDIGNAGAYAVGYGYGSSYGSNYNADSSGAYSQDEQLECDVKKFVAESVTQDWKNHDWNQRFQEVFSKYLKVQEVDTSLREYQHISTELFQLAQDFLECVKTYGKIIIEERYFQEKTIDPIDLGGKAGGAKYIIRGILFKFAIDDVGLYKGDWGAIKVAGQEYLSRLSQRRW